MLTVHYSSTRAEIWRWYWRAWAKPRGLWRYHVLLGFGIAIIVSIVGGSGNFDFGKVLINALAGTLGFMVLLPLWPLVRFKPAQRSLTIDVDGFKTQIGSLSGSRSWKQVRSIDDDGDAIAIVGSNNNAMIVPARAFDSASARQEFLTAARSWHDAAVAA